MARPYIRTSMDELSALGGPEISVLRTLHRKHRLSWASLSGMHLAGRPVTRGHLRMSAANLAQADVMPAKSDAPPTRLLKRPIASAHLAYAAGIYCRLDPNWEKTRTVDAYYLLASWEIFLNSVALGYGPWTSVMEALPDPAPYTPMELRDHWFTLRALVSDLVDLVYCHDCGLPRLTIKAAPIDSNWLMLPPGCMVCNFQSSLKTALKPKSNVSSLPTVHSMRFAQKG